MNYVSILMNESRKTHQRGMFQIIKREKMVVQRVSSRLISREYFI